MDRIPPLDNLRPVAVSPAFQLPVIQPNVASRAARQTQETQQQLPLPAVLPRNANFPIQQIASRAANVVNVAFLAAGANRNAPPAQPQPRFAALAATGVEQGNLQPAPPGVSPAHVILASIQQVQRMGELPQVPLALQINLTA